MQLVGMGKHRKFPHYMYVSVEHIVYFEVKTACLWDKINFAY